MLLSSLAKKTLKLEAVEAQQSPLPAENLRKEHEAALELLSVFETKFVTSDGTPHAGTILSAAAWLTGICLYQSFQEKPGMIFNLDDVNREWQNLVYLLEEYNFQRVDIPVGRVVLGAMAAPHFFKPQIEMLCMQNELCDLYHSLTKKHGFETFGGVHAGIILCSILIQRYSQAGIIDIEAATGLAAQGIFEAARQCIRS